MLENISELWEKAFLIREVEEELLNLFQQNKIHGTIHTCVGQEWTGVSVFNSLKNSDLCISNHRCHGHFLAKTNNVDGLIAEIMGRQSGVCGGRGGSQHLCSKGFFSNGVQGSIVPVAAGLSFSQKLSRNNGIAVLFIGDGTLGEGVLYETLNIISLWSLPLLIVLENNFYAQSTSYVQYISGDICDRAKSFDIKTMESNTWEIDNLLKSADDAVNYVRNECKPLFLKIDTYRLNSHSKGDDNRLESEIKKYSNIDPINVFKRKYPEESEKIIKKISKRIKKSVSKAENDVFQKTKNINNIHYDSNELIWENINHEVKDRICNRIYSGLNSVMFENPKIILMGEDIESPYGGTFKVTKDLKDLFPDRVLNTPISESAIIGIGNGLAISGYFPICEIMFGDFITLAADQIINTTSKMKYMYNEQINVPIIIRTPMGGGRGYGPTHSQSLEKLFLGTPDLTILATNHRIDPKDIYNSIFINHASPILFIENKILYGKNLEDFTPTGFILEKSNEKFPTVRIRPERPADLTILCYGGMLLDVEDAIEELFEEYDIFAEIICPYSIYPFNIKTIIESISSHGKLLIVEEGINYSSFSSEIISQIAEVFPKSLKNIKRLGSTILPIPNCRILEMDILPNKNGIVNKAVELINNE